MKVRKPVEIVDESAWIEAAFDLLVSGSIDSVAVEPLAKRLGVTKGSFYWHFKDRAALHQALLRTWKQRATLSIIDRLEHSHLTAEERLRQLIALPYPATARRAGQIDLSIRAWARRDEIAAAAVSEVDQQRLAYLAALFRGSGLNGSDAEARAYVFYAYNFAETVISRTESAEETRHRHDLCAEFLMGDLPRVRKSARPSRGA